MTLFRAVIAGERRFRRDNKTVRLNGNKAGVKNFTTFACNSIPLIGKELHGLIESGYALQRNNMLRIRLARWTEGVVRTEMLSFRLDLTY